MNVTADPAPMFVCGSHCALSTYMGQMLHFNVSFLDIPHPDEAVAISVYTQGLTLDGAVPMGGAVIAPVGGLWQTSQLMGWFPEAAYGGFSGARPCTASLYGRAPPVGCFLPRGR